MVALLYWIAKLELETIKVEISDFPFFSHQLIVQELKSSTVGTFLLSKMSLSVLNVKLLLYKEKPGFENFMLWNPPWGILILGDFRPIGYKLSCWGSL